MSCLFDSLSFFFKTKTAHELRQDICDYLQANKPLVEGLDTSLVLNIDSGPDYVSKMRKGYTWGGGIEIQAACSLWKLRVIVHDVRHGTDAKVVFNPVNNVPPRHEVHLNWSGNHYEPSHKIQLL